MSIPYNPEYRYRVGGGVREGDDGETRKKKKEAALADFVSDFGFVPSSQSEYDEAKQIYNLGFRGSQVKQILSDLKNRGSGASSLFYDLRFRLSIFFGFLICFIYLLFKK